MDKQREKLDQHCYWQAELMNESGKVESLTGRIPFFFVFRRHKLARCKNCLFHGEMQEGRRILSSLFHKIN